MAKPEYPRMMSWSGTRAFQLTTWKNTTALLVSDIPRPRHFVAGRHISRPCMRIFLSVELLPVIRYAHITFITSLFLNLESRLTIEEREGIDPKSTLEGPCTYIDHSSNNVAALILLSHSGKGTSSSIKIFGAIALLYLDWRTDYTLLP